MDNTYLKDILENLYHNIDTSINVCISLYGFIKYKGSDYNVYIHKDISIVEYFRADDPSNLDIVEDFDTIKKYIYDMLCNLIYLYEVNEKGYRGVTTYMYRYHTVRYNKDEYYNHLKSKQYESRMEYVYFLRYFGMFAYYDAIKGTMTFSTNKKPWLDAFIKEATDYDMLEFNLYTSMIRLHNRKTGITIRISITSLLDIDMFSRYKTAHIMGYNKTYLFNTFKILNHYINPKYIRPLPVKQFGHTGIITNSQITRERPDIAKYDIGEHHDDSYTNSNDSFSDILQADCNRIKPKRVIEKIKGWLK